ncbi:MAG: peptide MFS transporter [Holophagaceae bacterium]|nr:peptide MFS transporter [Holophagaceae bacterium]
MNLLPLAIQATPVTLSAFTPLAVALALWVGFVGYGLFSLRNHPKGLNPLFFTEMWERFSYYGMRALLLLYMTAPASAGGLGLSLKFAGLLYGLYTFFVYALSVPGGWIADRFLGYRKAVLVGGVLIALGEFSLASGPLAMFYLGLAVIAVGTGLLKTNCTSIVGMLYDKNDPRQDGGYTIYYMGINIGALIAPLILGFMAQDPVFVAALGKVGLASANGWRWAFGFAGLAMVAGLVQYSLRQSSLGNVGMKPGGISEHGEQIVHEPLTPEERSRMWVVVILVFFIMIFFFVFEQAGTTLNLFADEHTRMEIFGFTIRSTWFQSVNSIWLLFLAPIFSWLWIALKEKEPSSPIKFTLGLFFVGAGMLLLVLPSQAYTADPTLKVAPYWLIGTYGLHTIGELCLSPVGLSTVSKLAPARYSGVMMGVFFFAIGMGNMLAGLAGGFSESLKPATLFGGLFAITTVMAIVLVALTPRIKRMMGGVN